MRHNWYTYFKIDSDVIKKFLPVRMLFFATI